MEYMARTEQQWVKNYLENYVEEYVEGLKNRDLSDKNEKYNVQREISILCSCTKNKLTDKMVKLYKKLYRYNKYEIERILKN
ncbi:hypothetical protein JMUB3934_1230 [Leptotrichia wadei]|uniref:Uncharacterized protein n=1 Tax=Leptotrichia wadei TaxID=157687 RepID=A0A510KEA9_9FUSO|nr:hypothetical protein JMUB3934_1230 [Leptotrichia wadei]